MAITKAKKSTIVEGYGEQLARSQAVVLTEYRGMTVGGITELRRKLREVGGGFQVIKNTLFERALKEAGIPVTAHQLKGPIAVGYCYGAVPPVVKTLLEYAKESEALKLQGAFFGKSYVNAEGAKALAELPPREVVLAGLLGAIQAPMSSLASVLAAPLREIAQVLRARSEQSREAAA